MTYREATIADIEQLSRIRMSVHENVLVNENLVTYDLYVDYLTTRGKGWLCEADGKVVGFAIADVVGSSIWALFVSPAYEGLGIGGRLHDMMLGWYFTRGKHKVWLTTSPGTRAEAFYRHKGWQETSRTQSGEIRFEYTRPL